MLAEPPDFGLMTLSDDSRLGIFVVARLAHRHGVRVTLTESPAYGGIRAIVLVPNAVLVDATAVDGATSADAGPAPAGSSNGSADGHAGTTNGVSPGHAITPPVATDPAEVAAGDAPGRTPVEVAADSTAVEDAVEAVARLVSDEDLARRRARRAGDPGPLPVLPERRPQVHLAHELREEPDLDDDGAEEEPPVQRSRAAMSALQKASRAARNGQPPGRDGDRP